MRGVKDSKDGGVVESYVSADSMLTSFLYHLIRHLSLTLSIPKLIIPISLKHKQPCHRVLQSYSSMKIYLLSIVLVLLSAPNAAARDVDGHLRQDTRRSTLIDKQHLINGDKENQVDEESSSRFIKVFTNRRLPKWLTEHAVTVKHDNNAVHLEEQEQDDNERELLSPWCDPTTPVEWHP